MWNERSTIEKVYNHPFLGESFRLLKVKIDNIEYYIELEQKDICNIKPNYYQDLEDITKSDNFHKTVSNKLQDSTFITTSILRKGKLLIPIMGENDQTKSFEGITVEINALTVFIGDTDNKLTIKKESGKIKFFITKNPENKLIPIPYLSDSIIKKYTS